MVAPQTVSLPAWAEPGTDRPRVVSHSCSNTEIICALGCADLLVGVDDHSDYPVEVVSRLSKVGADLQVNPQKVKALRPDLVIASDTVPGHDQCIAALQGEGLNVEVIAPRSLDDVADNMRTIAALLGVPERGEALASAFQSQLFTDRLSSHGSPPVLVEWWPKPVIVPGKQSWVTDLLTLAGASNPWQGCDAESLPVTPSQVVEAAPEAVVIAWCGVAEDKYHRHVVQQREGWETVPAVANDRIFPITEAWLGRPGPRLLEGLQALRQVVSAIA